MRELSDNGVGKVLLVVTSWERALELRDDGDCKLISGDAACRRWTYDHSLGAWETFPLKTRLQWTDEERASFLRLCVETGVIGDLVFHVAQKSSFSEKHLAKRCTVIGNEWSMGVRALLHSGRSQW